MMNRFGQPLADRDYIPRPSSYGLLLRDKSEVLVVETAGGMRYLPGGGIQEGETAESAVVREFIEETGFYVSCRSLLGQGIQLVHALQEPNGYEKHCSFFLVELAQRPQRSCIEYWPIWLSLQEAKRSLHEEVQRWLMDQVSRDTGTSPQ